MKVPLLFEVGENVVLCNDDGSVEHGIVYGIADNKIQVINQDGDAIIDIDLIKTPNKVRPECLILPLILTKVEIKRLLSGVCLSQDIEKFTSLEDTGRIVVEFVRYLVARHNNKISEEVSMLINKLFDEARNKSDDE